MNTKALETGSEASYGGLNPPLCGIVQLTNSDALHFRNWSFNNNFDIIIMAGKYPMGIMRIYTAMVERVKIFHDCPSPKLYRSRLLQSRAQEDNSVSISWLGTAGVLVSDGKIGILIDPYVSRFGFFKIAMGLHLQPNKDLVKSWTARHGNRCVSGGIRSTLNAGRGASLEEERLKAVKPGQTITLRAFTLKFIESSHVPAFLGRVPYP